MQLNINKLDSFLSVLGTFAVCLTAVTATAQQLPVNLRSTSTFAALAYSTITVTGGAGGSITGNIGVSSTGGFVPGTPPVVVNGTVYLSDAITAQAQIDLGQAINDITTRANPSVLDPNVSNETLFAGFYKSASSVQILSGNLTLDAQNNPNAVFIFWIPSSTLTVASNRSVVLVNGANPNNIFWYVGSSATLGTNSNFEGTILASVSITMDTGAKLTGRALANTGAVSIDTGGGTSAVIPGSPPAQFIPVTPCRAVDTRNPTGPLGGPFVAAQTVRSFIIPSSNCNIPSTALAYSFNVAVVPHGVFAYLTAWPTGHLQPYVSTLNSDGRIKSSGAIIPAGTAGAVSVFVTQDADVVLDINGYFAPLNTAGELAFYPVAPCRVSDTRNAVGPFGGPFITGQTTRTIAIPASSCGIPSGAGAYSINLGVVPHVPLGYVTVWPTGTTQPYVASMNASSDVVTSNAAIVPAGTAGAINIFASNDTEVVVDINGYFAAPAVGGLSLYTLTPCRSFDTRLPAGSPAFAGTIPLLITSSACGVPSAAEAYVFNATAVPTGPLGYVTLWDQADAQPGTASINAVDGATTNNMAIVSSTNGSVSAYASNSTYLVLDIFGYFAP